MLLAVNYHYVRKSFETPYPSFFGITPENLRKQLEGLSLHGTFVSANQINEAVNGKTQLPARSIVITFDDGLKEQYEQALPVLDDMGIPAIFFVNTINLESKVSEVHKIHLLRSVINPQDFLEQAMNFIERNHLNGISLADAQQAGKAQYLYDNEDTAALKYILNFMLPPPFLSALCKSLFDSFFNERNIAEQMYFSREQFKILLDRDMIGAHGHEHLPLGTLKESDKSKQVQKAQEILSELGGKTVPAFSYPYGSEVACKGMEDVLNANSAQLRNV